MRNHLCVWVWLVLFAGCQYSNDPYQSVCQITTDGGQGSGTLVAVSGGKALILTCRHVANSVETDVKVQWLAAGNQESAGKVVSVVNGNEFNNDLAVVIADAPKGVQPVPVSEFNQQHGPFRCVGFRRGVMYESLAMSAYEKNGLITLSEPFIGGMSGGPVFDRFGHVVGVVVGSDMKTFGVAANGHYLKQLITRFSK